MFLATIDLAVSFFLFALLCWLCPSCLSGCILLIVFIYSICLFGDAPPFPSRPSQEFLGCCSGVVGCLGALIGPSFAVLLPPRWSAVALLLAFLLGLSFLDHDSTLFDGLDSFLGSIPSLSSTVSSSSSPLALRCRWKMLEIMQVTMCGLWQLLLRRNQYRNCRNTWRQN